MANAAACCDPAGSGIDAKNLSAYKCGWVCEIVETAGCDLIYLPSYSPEVKPIEEAFAGVKDLLRRAQARNCEVSIRTMG